MRITIAEHMLNILNEQNRNSVWYGDLDEIHECASRAMMYEQNFNNHPLNINNRVLNSLDKGDLFIKTYIKHIGRSARCFVIKNL